jgi:hypothetical protein
MAQAAHAATAVMVKYREHENVKSYEQDLDNMRKVRIFTTVLKLLYCEAGSSRYHPKRLCYK